MRCLRSEYSSLATVQEQEQLMRSLCVDDPLSLFTPTKRHNQQCRDDDEEGSVMDVMAHFLSTYYYRANTAAHVVRYLGQALRQGGTWSRWMYVSPCSGSILMRSVIRALVSAEVLHNLYEQESLGDYLSILEATVAEDAEGLMTHFAQSDMQPTDGTALHALMLIPGRLAQRYPHLSLSLMTPIVHSCERILSSLLRGSAHICRFLHDHVTPSAVKILLENLHLIPRAEKGLRLTVMLTVVRVLVAASEAEDAEGGRLWLEDFSLSEGPYQLYFAVHEWVGGGMGARTTTELNVAALAPLLDNGGPADMMEPEHEVRMIDPLEQTHSPPGPSTTHHEEAPASPPVEFDPLHPLQCPEDRLLYDILCHLVALPDDGSPFLSRWYHFLRDTLTVATYLPSSSLGVGSMSTEFDDRLSSFATSSGGSSVMGLQLGFRVLVYAASCAFTTRPTLGYFLSRVVVCVLKCRSVDVVESGLVSPELCDVLHHLLSLPNSDWDVDLSFIDAQPQHNNEYMSYVTTVVSLYAHCCKSLTYWRRQEEGAMSLAKIVVALVADRRDLVSCAAVQSVMFYAITAPPANVASQQTPAPTFTHSRSVSIMSRSTTRPSPNSSMAATTSTQVADCTTSGAVMYNRLIAAGLGMAVASELILDNTAHRRKLSLLGLLEDVSVRCPALQAELIPLSANLVQLIRTAAQDPAAHVLLPHCSRLLARLRLGQYDRAHIVCHSLLGTLTQLDPADTRALVASCWAAQTLSQLVTRERVAQDFVRDFRQDVIGVVRTLCHELQQQYTERTGSNKEDATDDWIDVPAPGETPTKQPDIRSGARNNLQDAVDDHDLCVLWGSMQAFHRQRHDVRKDGSAASDEQRYLMLCDCLMLTLHVLMVTQCLQQGYVADDLASQLVRSIALGPMLQCRLFTSIVARCLVGMSSFSTLTVLSTVHHVGKISVLSAPSLPKRCNRVTLQDFTSGWQIATTIGDQLHRSKQHRIVRPQYVRAILDLLLSATPAANPRGFELIVSVVELLYHSFHHRTENVYVLAMCGVWDAAVCQLVRICTSNPRLKPLCVHVISSAMRLFGLHGLGSVPISSHLLLCFDEEASDIVSDNISRVFSSWEWLLHNSLPCRVPLSFVSLPFGCECVSRLHTSTTSIIKMKQEVQLEGGIDVAVNYDVWRFPVDSHITAVLWIMIDYSTSHHGDMVLCSLHFDRNRVVVELCGDEKGNLFVGLMHRNMGEMRTRRVLLGKLPALPNKQWMMLHLSVENFAAKSHASLRTKFSTKFCVGIQALHGNHHHFEATIQTPEIDMAQSLREKSLSTCTALTHICVGGIHRNSGGSAAVPTSALTSRRFEDDWHTSSPTQRTMVMESEASWSSPTRWDPAVDDNDDNLPSATHQLFFAAMALFQGELSSFDALVLFVMGPDAMMSLDFLDRTTVINLYPLLARLATESMRPAVASSLGLLASLWLRRQETSSEDSAVLQFTGYFPFTKIHRDKLVCVLGASQQDITLWSRSESSSSARAEQQATANSSPPSTVDSLTQGLTQGTSLHSPSGSSLTPQNSFAPSTSMMIGESFAFGQSVTTSDKQSVSNLTAHGSAYPANAPQATEFVYHPKSKGLAQYPLDVSFDESPWHGGIVWQDAATFLHRPVAFTVPPIYASFDAVGGLQMFLWVATLLEPGSSAQVLVFQSACTWLSLHYGKPMSDVWSGESSKGQDVTLLTAILHHRLDITRDIAECVTRCAGYPLMMRIDLIPLLLDFSLWARDADALICITSYLCELQVSSNSFGKFNAGVLRYRRMGDRHNHHVLQEILLHLHMRFVGTTISGWDARTIPSVRSLIAMTCSDVAALARITASAAWLTSEDDPLCIPWVTCLLDAALSALHERHAAVMPADASSIPASLITNLTSILKSNNDQVRRRALECFTLLSLLPFEIVAGGVSAYEARSILGGPRRCLTTAELRILMSRAVGGDKWLVPDRPALVPISALPLGGDGLPPIQTSCPIIFFLMTLTPYLPEVQQLAIIAFVHEHFNGVPVVRRAMLSRSFALEVGLEDPFSSLILYAIAETVERSDRSLEVGCGATMCALVELLIDVLTYPLTHPSLHADMLSAIDSVHTAAFSLLNIFIDEADIGQRSPTPLFHCVRRHVLNVMCACIRACESQLIAASHPVYVDGCLQLLDIANDITTLLYIPTSANADNSPMMASHSPHSALLQPPGSAPSRSSQQHWAQETIFCSFFERHSLTPATKTRLRRDDEDERLLCVHRYHRLLSSTQAVPGSSGSMFVTSPTTQHQGPLPASGEFVPQQHSEEGTHNLRPTTHFYKSNIDLLPLYALEFSARLHAFIAYGAAPLCANMDKHRVSLKCSMLHQQQLKLISFLLTIETNAIDDQQDDSDLDELQTLCIVHTFHVGATTFGVAPATAAGTSDPKKSKPLLSVPKQARWSPESIGFVPDSLLAAAVAKYKEPTIAVLTAVARFLSRVADPDHRTAFMQQRAMLGHNMLRVALCYIKPVAFRKDLNDSCIQELEKFAHDYMSITSCFVEPRTLSFLERLPRLLLSTHGHALLQGHTTSLLTKAVQRARQNLRVDSSKIPLLDPQRAVDGRHRMDGGMQKLQAATMKRAAFYEKMVEHDTRVILAVNAAYRFALLPWWGSLATLHTDQRVALNRFELDRFMGPNWERSRLRRFAHEPKMLTSEGNAIRFQSPLASLTSRLAAGDAAWEGGRRDEDDDMELLSLFGLSAVPQSVHQRVLMQSESASHRCLLILPMDRVPVVLTLSHVGILIRAEMPPTARSEAIHDAHTAGNKSEPKKLRRGTLSSACGSRAHRLRVDTSSSSQGAGGTYRYRHEMHDRVVPMSSIRAVWPRRNLLQQVALELLLDSGESIFLSFTSQGERKVIMDKVTHYAKTYLDKTLVVNQNNLNVWRAWWCEGRITNFKYLMFLNFCAGRSYGDMRQYPVFPHVVGDYYSEVLDLKATATFRLMDKPMGAQIPEKEQRAMELYETLLETSSNCGVETADLAGQMVWHYGTHYAPLACVLQSLVRVQPFGDYFLDMNSKLDEPDRVFESMANQYNNYTGNNSRLCKDVREMVPEFYCLPEMLVNTNEVPFGTKQDGSVVNHVQLPPWSANPRDFVVALHQALECQHTSERLHLWIDLIFGYKQRGREAVAAVNVYHPLTYEKAVDLSTVEDPVELKSHVTQIDNFGQTPVQLFPRAAHKARCKQNAEFFSIPCPTLRYEQAFARSSVLLFPERLSAATAAPATSAGSAAAAPGGGTASWIVFCRSPISNAALGADELGDFFLTSVTSRSLYHVLPFNVLPFTVVADVPKDFIVVRPHSVGLVDGRELNKDLTSAHITKALTTVAAVQPPFAFIGTTCGSIIVVEVRYQDTAECEIPTPPPQAVAATKPTSHPHAATSSHSANTTNDADLTSRHWVPEFQEGAHSVLDFFSLDGKTSKVKSPHIKQVDCLFGHHGTVVALTVAIEWGILVSAAQDWVLAVWDLHRRLLLRTIPYPDLQPAKPISLLQQRLTHPWQFIPHTISVNPLRGDIVVAGLAASQQGSNNHTSKENTGSCQPEIRVFTINGELAATVPWKTLPTAILAMGPLLFAAEGRTLAVLDSVTLGRRCELQHYALEDSIASIAMNPYGTHVAAVDKLGNAGSWKVT